MKIAFTADQHARGKDLDAFRAQWGELWDICRSRGVEHVISCGDLFDGQNIGDKSAETAAIIEAVAEPIIGHREGPEFHVVSGNHDQDGPARRSAALAMIGIPEISVYTSAKVVPLVEETACFFFLPWIYGDMTAALVGLAERRNTAGLIGEHSILVAHAQVVGASLNKLKASDHGIPREHPAWAAFDKVALGDFHKRQQLWPNGGYIGALRQLHHGEEGNPAGFEIYDTETRESEWIELNAAPRYCTSRVYTVEELQRFVPVPAHINRVVCCGFIPPHDLASKMELSGVSLVAEVERLERIDRGAEVSEGALQQPRSLIRVYNDTQSQPLGDGAVEELEALFDEVMP
jgi:DNA repair exonuclease SbcCD nuclease subunit